MATQARATQARTGAGDAGILVGSLLVVLAAAATSFSRLFEGGPAALRLVAAGLASVGLAALLRRRPLVVHIAATSVALLVALGIMVFPGTTLAGLPTPSTVSELLRSLGRLGQQAAQEIAPAPALPSLMAASMIAVWTAGAAAHALAARSRSAVLALLPPAALLAFAGLVTRQGPTLRSTAVFLAGGLGVIFGVGVGRLALWGPLVAARGPRLATGPTGRWGLRLGLVAVGLALLLPGLLPGYRAGPVVTFEPGPVQEVNISPIVDIRPSLLQNPPATLFTVQADRPAYWRLLSLDRFDGELWTSSNPSGTGGRVVTGSSQLESSTVSGETLIQHYRIAALTVQWLPAAWEPASISLDLTADSGSSVRHQPDSQMLVKGDRTHRGYEYTVVSALDAPAPRTLDRASLGLPGGVLAQYQRYLELPPDLPPDIEQFARQVSAGEPTAFRQLLAIQERLRSFTYDLHSPPGHGANHIVNFLTETRQGFCEQFAGAFAVLARTLGYPSRVAVGFTPGTVDPSGRYVVTTAEAHAWPEVYFPSRGWVAFEPTPTRDNPVASRYLEPVSGPIGGGFRRDPAAGARTDQVGRSAQREAFERLREGRGPGAARREAPPGERLRPMATAAVILAVLAVLVLAVVVVGKWAARRLVLRGAASGRDRVLTAYRVFLATGMDLGLGRRPGETLAEYRDRLRREVRFSDGHLERLTDLASRALYAPGAVGPEDAGEAIEAARGLARDLRRHAGIGRSMAGAVRPTWPLP